VRVPRVSALSGAGARMRGKRFEYEQEILVKAAWNGVAVKSVRFTFYILNLPSACRISGRAGFFTHFQGEFQGGAHQDVSPFLIVDMPGDLAPENRGAFQL